MHRSLTILSLLLTLPTFALDRPAILAELTDHSPAGVDRRLGPDYDYYHKNNRELFPEIPIAESKQEPGGRRYQIGGPWSKKAGDFSSTQGQVLYAPDLIPGGGNGNGPPGAVDRVTILEWSNNCFSERPEPPWWGGFRPEPAYAKWWKATNFNPGQPIAIARGSGSWANCGILVFSSGLVTAAGTCTGRGLEPTLMLPPEKIPTAVSVTNKNEFALVTVVDTKLHKGQVAVISLESNGRKVKFVHEWHDDHPWSLPNVAVYTDLKLLGYVDLPDGFEFPTSITAVGNHEGGRMNGRDGNAGLLREYDLAKQPDRDVFLKGSNKDYGSTAGFAVVAGKYESKAAFLDLQPLFAKVRELYFTTEENYQKTRNAGPAPDQWPYTFDHDPSWKPTVVKTIDVPRPTAVLASMSGGKRARAFIASEDGRVGLYTLGGLATDEPANPEDIARVAETQVGPNPTCLAYRKYSRDQIIACSRGDREIAWIKYADKSTDVVKRLRDARLKDPVHLEQSDTHGIETPLITVCDFHGKQILNYRYGTLVWATQGGQKFGMGPDGKSEFECGGTLDFPGQPFAISAANVN